jgi:hypothetical protein
LRPVRLAAAGPRQRLALCSAVDKQKVDSGPSAAAGTPPPAEGLECFGTGQEVECRLVPDGPDPMPAPSTEQQGGCPVRSCWSALHVLQLQMARAAPATPQSSLLCHSSAATASAARQPAARRPACLPAGPPAPGVPLLLLGHQHGGDEAAGAAHHAPAGGLLAPHPRRPAAAGLGAAVGAAGAQGAHGLGGGGAVWTRGCRMLPGKPASQTILWRLQAHALAGQMCSGVVGGACWPPRKCPPHSDTLPLLLPACCRASWLRACSAPLRGLEA